MRWFIATTVTLLIAGYATFGVYLYRAGYGLEAELMATFGFVAAMAGSLAFLVASEYS